MLSGGQLPAPVRQRLEAAVAAAEATSAVELVVVVAARAEPYRAEALLSGGLAAGAMLLLVVLAPPAIPTLPGLAAVLGAGALAWRVAGRSPRWLRRLVPPARREEGLRRLSKVLAHDEALTGTRDRTGLLVLVGCLEERLVLLGDVGVRRTLGEGALLEEERSFREAGGTLAERLEGTLRRLGERLAPLLPPRPDDGNELPDRIRVLAEP